MADRYTYVPLIGIFIAITWGVSDALEGWRYHRAAMAAVSVAVLAVCLRLTATQVRYWQNTETLTRHALAVTPDNTDMQVLLGNALLDEGKYAEAGRHFSDVLSIRPNDFHAQSGLALALADEGLTNEAIEAYRAAIAINPHEAKPHYMLAGLLTRQGKFMEAIAEYQMTLQIEPNHPLALNDLAWLLSTAPDARFRNGTEAVRRAEQACQVTGYEVPLFVGTLAAAYAEAGRFDDAVKTAQQAINLATAEKKEALVDKNKELLALYQAHKTYHQPASH
jgi:Flp pilus assembly protein TadD